MGNLTVTPDLSGGILSAISAIAGTAEAGLKELLQHEGLENQPDVKASVQALHDQAIRTKFTADAAQRNLAAERLDAST